MIHFKSYHPESSMCVIKPLCMQWLSNCHYNDMAGLTAVSAITKDLWSSVFC